MPAQSLQNLSILMVVPSLLQGRFLAKALNDQGSVRISESKNISQALASMKENVPDLVISSMYFEDGDGIELVQSMRADEALENILFMLVSSEERFEMLDPIRQAGVIAVLPKPFHYEDILKALDKTVLFLAEDQLHDKTIELDQMRVLMVDDSRLARRHLLKILLKLGVSETNVHQAEDGVLAIEVLKEHSFDVVLSDFNMPQLDGQGLLKYIRQQDELSAVPVIMITSERNQTLLSSIQENGVTALLDKPFDPAHLQDLLENHV